MQQLSKWAQVFFALAVPTLVWAETTVGEVERLSGRATVVRQANTVDAITGLALFQADKLSTGPASTIYASLLDGSKLVLGADSELVLRQVIYDADRPQDGRVSLLLRLGELEMTTGDVAESGGQVILSTPFGDIYASNTTFQVSLNEGNGGPVLTVSNGAGQLEIRRDGVVTTIPSNSTLRVNDGGPVRVEAGPEPRDNLFFDAGPDTLDRIEAVPTQAPSPTDPPGPSLTPTPSPTASPSPSVTPTPAPTTSPSPSLTPTPAPTTSPSPSLTPTPAPTTSPSPSLTPTPAPTTSPSPSLTPTPAPTTSPSPSLTPTPAPTTSPSPSPSPPPPTTTPTPPSPF
nr:FecR domain-containing protein [Oceanococcus sp. HetDA_MAG_MS8]